jgi:hypothetical protein
MPMRSQKSGSCRKALKSQRSRRGSASAKPIFLIARPPLHMLNASLPGSQHGLLSHCLASISSTLRDETRDACFHHLIQPLPGSNTVDFVQGVLRQRRDV